MYARAHKVDARCLTLTVDDFKLLSKGTQGQVGIAHVCMTDLVLVHKLDTIHEFTEVRVIDLGKDVIQQARGQAIEVEQEFPCFVATS